MKITVKTLQKMKEQGKKISALTAYDTLFAAYLDRAGIDVILVGDSAGMVVAGYESTVPVTMEQMIYHAQCAKRGVKNALLVVDMPFMSYQVSPEDALRNAGRLLKEGGAEAVKLEGGKTVAAQIRTCVEAGIPVMGHLGMTPQSVNMFGGFKTQGKTSEEAKKIKEDALAVQEAGAFSLVMEKVPALLAKEISEMLKIPTIGIGAGADTDGQILVTQDMLGMFEEFKPKFVRLYANLAEEISKAAGQYAEDVRKGAFPSDEESY
ncbi:MAG: 3-methyl-2-oxobutanoate hydroxymethyltransferase [Candidatus Marinimicrobia bacterium]|nr:3-methyl-2-oxobutanoate hydroxymethyltransferase [Candidatus Neomarinimicrobiota bacterium]MDD5709016.1 3-methyl-2-oxobutanoate hydroxymethyltransferase [Candidatus Neomarinimicrobiota bacterium]